MENKCKLLILALVFILRTQGIIGESHELEEERETLKERVRDLVRARDSAHDRDRERQLNRERARDRARERDRGTAPTKVSLPALMSTTSSGSVETGLNSSETNRHDLEYESSASFEDKLAELTGSRDRDRARARKSDIDTSASTNYWQFRKMPDADDNYKEGSGSSDDYDDAGGDADAGDGTEAEEEQFGEVTVPSVQMQEIIYPPAEDRFITRHSKKISLPTYTTIYTNNRFIPHGHGPRHGRRGRGGRGRKPHGHGPPHHSHHHQQHHEPHGEYQKFMPSYISYGPIMGHPPNAGSHSSMAPVYVPSVRGGRGHGGHGHQQGHHHGFGHGHGQHGSHSHTNAFTAMPSGGAPPLPPLLGNMAPQHLGPPMAAIYVPPSPLPSVAPNHYPAALPYNDDNWSQEKYYKNYSPPKSKPGYRRPPPSYRSQSPSYSKNTYGAHSNAVYIPVPPGYNRNRHSSASTAPRPLYQTPAISYGSSGPGQLYQKPENSYIPPGQSGQYGSPPMNFGQPMHNYGPPMSSYGKPPPIIGDMPISIYEPTDDMYRYKNDPPSTTGSSTYKYSKGLWKNNSPKSQYGSGGGGTNFPRNQYGGGATNFPKNQYSGGSGGSGKNKYNNDWGGSSTEYGYGENGDSSEFIETTIYPTPPAPVVKPPVKPFRPPLFYSRNKKVPLENDNAAYNSNRYKSESPRPFQYAMPPSRKNRPPPSYDTQYNSPGLSMDPKIVDFMPYNSKDYRELKNRQRRIKSGKKEQYSTLPDPIQSHKPDPDHENYPKLTYEAIKKRVIDLTAAGDLQTSSTSNSEK